MKNELAVPVVYSTDHNYVMPTAVAIQTMLECSDDCRCEIYIFQSESVTDADRDMLRQTAEKGNAGISFMTMGEEFDGLFEIRNITTPTYYRLLIPWLLPQHDKVVYVDGDLIFCQSIRKLYEAASDADKWVYGVCPDAFTTGNKYRNYTASLGLDNKSYVNGGVLVFNSKAQREHNLREVYKSHFSKSYKYQDQDIINIVCKGRVGLLPHGFNSMFDEISEDTVIYHYAGVKPWRKFTWQWVYWWDAYRRSLFYDCRLLGIIEKASINAEPNTSDIVRQLLKRLLPGRLYDGLVMLNDKRLVNKRQGGKNKSKSK